MVYLVAIMDWVSRYVLSWDLSITLEVDFCIKALEKALDIAMPEIFNSDQGSQFTSVVFLECLEEKSIQISMDGKGRGYGRRRIAWFLLRENNIEISENTITHILRRAGLRRKKKQRKVFYPAKWTYDKDIPFKLA